jgi:hypothetical protein
MGSVVFFLLIQSQVSRVRKPTRAQADEEMLAALAAVTGIALHGDVVTLTGARPLRFRAAAN